MPWYWKITDIYLFLLSTFGFLLYAIGGILTIIHGEDKGVGILAVILSPALAFIAYRSLKSFLA